MDLNTQSKKSLKNGSKNKRDYEKNKEKRKAYAIEKHYLKFYGLTLEEVAELRSDYPCCAICSGDFSGCKDGVGHIDHDHTTGKIRGVLCSNCNMGLGMFKDKKELLMKAISYLNE